MLRNVILKLINIKLKVMLKKFKLNETILGFYFLFFVINCFSLFDFFFLLLKLNLKWKYFIKIFKRYKLIIFLQRSHKI